MKKVYTYENISKPMTCERLNIYVDPLGFLSHNTSEWEWEWEYDVEYSWAFRYVLKHPLPFPTSRQIAQRLPNQYNVSALFFSLGTFVNPYHFLLLDGSPKGEPIYIIRPKPPHNQLGGGKALCGTNKILRVFWWNNKNL